MSQQPARECTAEVVDGYEDPATCWGCDDCTDEIYDNLDREVEAGNVSPEEAYDAAVQFEQFGVIPG